MRRLAPLLLLATTSTAAPLAPAHVTLAPDTESRWVPFVLTAGNQIRFAMTVDGRPVSAVLDTGVSVSVLSRRFVAANRLAVRPGGRATAIGGSVAIGWTPTGRIALGGLIRDGGGLSVADVPALATGDAVPVDLLVGRDLLGAVALDIDHAARRFRLLQSGRLPFAGAVAPLAISREWLVYVGEVTLGDVRLAPVLVDTGDGSAVTLTERGWKAAAQLVPTTTAVSFGLAGKVTSRVAIVPELRVGALVARDIEVRVEPAGGFSDSIRMAGRIGTGFLGNYRVLLDPAAGRMVLRAEAGADRPPVRSTSGLLLGVAGDRLRVIHVMRGGPAEAAGWSGTESICRIDGDAIPPDYPHSPLAHWSAGEPGRVVALTLCDGETRRLTLRRFY